MTLETSARILRKTYVFAALGLAILVVLLGVTFYLFEQSRVVSEELLHAREERGTLFRLLLSVQDAETGQRGYLLTGEVSYLEPYNDAVRVTQERWNAVRSAFTAEEGKLAELGTLVTQKLTELAQSVQVFSEGRRDEAFAIVQQGSGKAIMDQIRERIGVLVEDADARLGASARRQVVIAEQTRLVTSVAAILIIAAAVGALVTIIRYTRELVLARVELAQANVSLEARVLERTSDLTRANEEIQRFAYIVSHDLRSPLVNIMGFTSELEESMASLKPIADEPALAAMSGGADAQRAIKTDVPEAISFIRRSTSKMDALIKAILELSREGRRVLSAERIDLGELLRSLAESVQHRLTEIGGEVTLGRLGVVHSDRLALEQIFGNLIDNAIKYRRPDVPLRLEISEQLESYGRCVVMVRDNGRGISPDDHERIFDLFRRAGTQDQPGEGIGLAHVRALARRLGGDIDVTSELGRGSTFKVKFNRHL
jgi:signal transduction histidine kinase